MSKDLLVYLVNTLWLKHKIHIGSSQLNTIIAEYKKLKYKVKNEEDL